MTGTAAPLLRPADLLPGSARSGGSRANASRLPSQNPGPMGRSCFISPPWSGSTGWPCSWRHCRRSTWRLGAPCSPPCGGDRTGRPPRGGTLVFGARGRACPSDYRGAIGVGHQAPSPCHLPLGDAARTDLWKSGPGRGLLGAPRMQVFPLSCPAVPNRCGSSPSVTEVDPIQRILEPLGEPIQPPPVAPARGPPTGRRTPIRAKSLRMP
jgi:hypothetical protein